MSMETFANMNQMWTSETLAAGMEQTVTDVSAPLVAHFE